MSEDEIRELAIKINQAQDREADAELMCMLVLAVVGLGIYLLISNFL